MDGKMYFNSKEIENGLFNDFLNSLIQYNQKSDDYYLDIHIKAEDNSLIIEWIQNPYNWESSKFVEINEDEYVMKEVRLPDGHYEYVRDEEEEKELWDSWIKDHPNWEKNQWGIWREKQE